MANGGLGNGVRREELSTVLKEMGEVEALVMPPYKPYAFVTYRCSCCKLKKKLLDKNRSVDFRCKHSVVLSLGLKKVLERLSLSLMDLSFIVKRTTSHFT